MKVFLTILVISLPTISYGLDNDSISIDYGKNILSFDPVRLTQASITFGYECFLNKSNGISLYTPLSYNFLFTGGFIGVGPRFYFGESDSKSRMYLGPQFQVGRISTSGVTLGNMSVMGRYEGTYLDTRMVFGRLFQASKRFSISSNVAFGMAFLSGDTGGIAPVASFGIAIGKRFDIE